MDAAGKCRIGPFGRRGARLVHLQEGLNYASDCCLSTRRCAECVLGVDEKRSASRQVRRKRVRCRPCTFWCSRRLVRRSLNQKLAILDPFVTFRSLGSNPYSGMQTDRYACLRKSCATVRTHPTSRIWVEMDMKMCISCSTSCVSHIVMDARLMS